MSEWISVKDALPKKDDKYLVVEDIHGYRVTNLRAFTKKCRLPEPELKGKKNIWYDLHWEYGDYYEVNWVTHWMPIPELPEEDPE